MSRWIAATTTARGTYLRLQCTVTAPVQTPCNGQKPDKEQNERCTSGTAGWSARAQEHQHNGWYRSTTPSGERMGYTQQPTITTTPYLCEQLLLHNVVVGRRFTTSSEDMENAQQLRGTTTQYLWEQVSCQTRYITSRLGWHTVAGSATQQSREERACTQQAIP